MQLKNNLAAPLSRVCREGFLNNLENKSQISFVAAHEKKTPHICLLIIFYVLWFCGQHRESRPTVHVCRPV